MSGGKKKTGPGGTKKPPAQGRPRANNAARSQPRKKSLQWGRGAAHGNAVSTNTMTYSRTPTTTMRNGSTFVSHTETYGINVSGSADFGLFSTWAIQPGLVSYSNGSPLGAWLPQIANNFDNYEIIGLEFKYRAACSTLQPGLVIFGFEPNPEGASPTTYQELRNMHSVDGSAHANLQFNVSARCRKSLLTRKSLVVNLPSYDAGKVYLATIGCDAGAKLGFVDVTYNIRLFNPQSSSSTTVVPRTVAQAAKPTQILRGGSPAANTINAATECAFVQSAWILGNTTLSNVGCPLGTVVTNAYPAISFSLGEGYSFSNAASTYRALRLATPGRYNIKMELPFDWEDLKMFAAVPLICRAGAWGVGQEEVYGDVQSSSALKVNCDPIGFRGFSGTAVGDPNPGTDLEFVAEWDISINAADDLIIAVGVRTYNSVSTTTANVKYPTGLGGPLLKLSYLGPSIV